MGYTAQADRQVRRIRPLCYSDFGLIQTVFPQGLKSDLLASHEGNDCRKLQLAVSQLRMGMGGSENIPGWLASHLPDDPVIAGDLADKISKEAEKNRLPGDRVVKTTRNEEDTFKKEQVEAYPDAAVAGVFASGSFLALLILAIYLLYVLSIVAGGTVADVPLPPILH
ncbi:hypothetical protein NKH41_13115 [Mesorhizobium sp. M1169]|uniref:hypothetical protein n=1 Tax=Mesorhizobium sp. M1169 TaxID=2957066 RepID=UPI003339E1A6